MGFSRQEYWSRFPSPGDPPNTGIEPSLLHCRQILDHRATCDIGPEKQVNWPSVQHNATKTPERLSIYISDYNKGTILFKLQFHDYLENY